MFKLVGDEYFTVGNVKCCLSIHSSMPFKYEYVLEVNGRSLKRFREHQSKILKSWTTILNGMEVRIVLGEFFSVDVHEDSNIQQS